MRKGRLWEAMSQLAKKYSGLQKTLRMNTVFTAANGALTSPYLYTLILSEPISYPDIYVQIL